MERKLYEPTEKQTAKWNAYKRPEMPTDEQFKAMWKKAHGGKEAGWGMKKRDWIASEMKYDPEYQRGIWQGRVDAARGLPYSEERNENTYNLGYYRGYTNYSSDTAGWDTATRDAFFAQYVNC
jgi:hypothetical protein